MPIALRGINLACFFIYSLLNDPITSPILLSTWLISIISTLFLAKHLNRHITLWGLGSFLIPFWCAAFLTFTRKRPENSLSDVDNSWLNMERPTNKMVVSGVLFFKESLDKSNLEETLNNGLLKFDRFQQKVGDIDGFKCWLDDSNFSLENHLKFHKLPKGASFEDFHQEVNHLTETPLDMTKPLWRMDVYDGLDGGSALVVRIHHCIADGIALVRVLLSMTQPLNDTDATPNTAKPHKKEHPLASLFYLIVGLLAAFPHALKLPDSESRLKRPLTGKRSTAWSPPFDLETVRHLANSNNGKINDIVLAITAGALRNYLLENGSNPDEMVLRVLVPINLKPLDGEIVLGNQVGFVYLPLPIQEPSTLGRLKTVKAEMDTIKGGQEAMLSLLFLKLIGSLPAQLQNIIIDTFNKNASSTMTNVPGPKSPLLFAGKELDNMMFFGPQSGTMGVGISVLSYAGKMTMGLNADSNLIPDTDRFVELFLKELDEWHHS